MGLVKKIAFCAGLLLVSLPVRAAASSMVVGNQQVNVGDSLEQLVRLAGRPDDIDFSTRCLNRRCNKIDIAEHWIYHRGEVTYDIRVQSDIIISIEIKPAPEKASPAPGEASEDQSQC